jgi:type I restriction enzyme S subunit
MSSKNKTTATKEDGKPAPVPKLRFPEFQNAGAWTTETLGSVVEISTEKVGDNTCIPMSITSGVGLVSQMDKFGRVIAGSSYKNYLLLKKNDFAYNKSATKEYPEGFIALYSGQELAAVPNSIFTCFRIKGESPVPEYLNYLLLGNLHGRWLRNFIEVGARAHGSLSIDEDDLLALPVPLPSGNASIREQQRIAKCLSSVDELIAAQGRKVDALKTHKKGLMQQLFPREGETQPRLRFPEFKGDWVLHTGDEITSKITKGSSPNWQGFSYQPQGVLFITSENVRDGFLDVSKPKFLPEEFFAKQSNSHLLYGDILINLVGASIGRNSVFRLHLPSFTNQAVALFRVTKTHSFEFVSYCYQHDRTQKAVSASQSDSARPNLSLGDLRQMKFSIPSLPEQQRIASCLSSLDALITAETQKLEALKIHKKGLMQQLFPASDEVEA